MNAKVTELFKDENFLKELAKTNSAEEAKKLIEAKGGEITVDELKAQMSDDLTEDELAKVSGAGLAHTVPTPTQDISKDTQTKI